MPSPPNKMTKLLSFDSPPQVMRRYDAEEGAVSEEVKLPELSAYEKKCILVGREIDSHGMRRYQWYIWILCGFGYLLDLLWAQAFGLVLSPLQQEMGFGDGQSGNIGTSFNAGMTAGALFWGLLADVIGRRWAFNLTCLISSIAGLCLGASNNYNTFLVLTAFVGFGIGGNIPIDTTITLEFIPKNKRFLLACLSVFQPLGVIICSAFAFAFIPVYSCSPNFSEPNPIPSCNINNPTTAGGGCCSRSSNMGWRYLLFTIGGLTLLIFVLRFFVFTFHESPKFLLYRRQDTQAIHTLHAMAKTNGTVCTLTLDTFKNIDLETPLPDDDDHDDIHSSSSPSLRPRNTENNNNPISTVLSPGRFKLLFRSPPVAYLTFLVWLTYAIDYFSFTVAGFYLPSILALKNGNLSVPLTSTYAAYIYTYTPGLFGVLLGSLMYRVPRVGRKYTLVTSASFMGVSILLLSMVDTRAKNEGLFALEYFFQSMFNAVLYGWTPEAFPAPVRATACGVAGFWGRLLGIVGPVVAGKLYGGGGGGGDVNAVLYLAGGVMFGCVLTTALLPGGVTRVDGERDD